jgi:hypothetical protein
MGRMGCKRLGGSLVDIGGTTGGLNALLLGLSEFLDVAVHRVLHAGGQHPSVGIGRQGCRHQCQCGASGSRGTYEDNSDLGSHGD